MQPYQEPIRRLLTIPGVDRITSWTILAELGPDMQVFPDARHAASWAGICPGNRESGGKRLNGRTRKANPYLRRVLCQAAWGASHSKNTYLAALYKRQRGKLGHNQAIFSLAHQLLLIAYTMLRRGEDYRELGSDYFDRKNRPKLVNRLVQRITKLGFYVTLQPAVMPDQQSAAIPLNEFFPVERNSIALCTTSLTRSPHTQARPPLQMRRTAYSLQSCCATPFISLIPHASAPDVFRRIVTFGPAMRLMPQVRLCFSIPQLLLFLTEKFVANTSLPGGRAALASSAFFTSYCCCDNLVLKKLRIANIDKLSSTNAVVAKEIFQYGDFFL